MYEYVIFFIIFFRAFLCKLGRRIVVCLWCDIWKRFVKIRIWILLQRYNVGSSFFSMLEVFSETFCVYWHHSILQWLRRKNLAYNVSDINEIKVEWANFFMKHHARKVLHINLAIFWLNMSLVHLILAIMLNY